MKLLKSIIFMIIFIGSLRMIESLSRQNFMNFEQYIIEYKKNYSSLQEYQKRLSLFYEGIDDIIIDKCHGCGINNFTDWSVEQLQALTGTITSIPLSPIPVSLTPPVTKAITYTNPLTFDWRTTGKITPAKNQGSCGSCWTFGTTGFFQADLMINDNYNNTIDLSEQYLISCQNRSFGCNGGYPFFALDFVLENGIPVETKVPYTPNTTLPPNICSIPEVIRMNNTRKQISYFNVKNQKLVQNLITKKPVNINICANSLYLYSPTTTSRTLECGTSTQVNHNVLLVGYTQTQWIIKNSWGPNWGLSGFAYISRNQSMDCCIGDSYFTTGNISPTCNVAGCQVCVQQNACARCLPGKFVRNTEQNHICYNCPSTTTNCKQCLNYYGFCEFCNDGYALDYPSWQCVPVTDKGCSYIANTKCVECRKGFIYSNNYSCIMSCNVTNCGLCSTPDVCQTCKSGYTLNTTSNKCIPICKDSKCQICDNNRDCLKCLIGHVLSNYTCTLSTTCNVGCKKCNGSKYCSQCENSQNYTLINGTCKPLCKDVYCANCTTPDICSVCKEGFSLNSEGVCIKNQCNMFCKLCRTDKSCLLCESTENFTLTNGTCKPICGPYCINCTAPRICANCLIGYDLVIDNNNTLCSKKQCQFLGQIFNGQKCLCPRGTYLDINECKKCPINCVQCQNMKTCDKCIKSFYLNSTNLCQRCMLNCVLCSNKDKCDLCALGFKMNTTSNICQKLNSDGGSTFLTEDKKIFKCPHGCLTCTGQNTCTQCQMGFALVSNICEKCMGNCKSCQYNNDVKTCTQCFDGFSLSENKCKKCQANNCFICSTTSNICTQCMKGFYLENYSCTKCNVKNCQQCSSSNVCNKCIFGFIALADGTCSQCISGCDSCSNTNLALCSTCLKGTFLNNTKCQHCPKQCLQCNSVTQCTSCIEGFKLNSAKKCIRNCDNRNCARCQKDYRVCQECFAGYNLTNNKCIFDSNCNQKKNCISCPQKFYLTPEKVCVECPSIQSNQLTCNPQAPTLPTSCENGFYLSEQSTCKNCSSKCKTCSSQSFCITCIDGYFAYKQDQVLTGQCKVCDSSCKTCEVKQTFCLSCYDGYQLNTHKMCLPYSRIIYTLNLNMDFNDYTNKINTIIDDLVSILKLKDRKLVQIQKAKSGSTLLQGYIATTENLQSSVSTLNSALSTGSVGGVPLNSVSLAMQGNTIKQEEDNNLIIIIAASVGGCVFILACVITYFIVKKYCYSSQVQSDPQMVKQSNNQYELTQKIDNPNHNNAQMKSKRSNHLNISNVQLYDKNINNSIQIHNFDNYGSSNIIR